ncbi:MAG: 50S ribosomal protein L31 [Thermoflexaceae bacterium]|nr:50S ribosomal protein L31 [Thermoflexaceae bacterium]
MKPGTHPRYEAARIHCSCGNEIETRSTKQMMRLDVCNMCHPFFTGEHRIVDTAGRVERFNRRYQRQTS